jgi:hypothetical protein
MDLDELLKQHQLWLDKAHAALTTTTGAAQDVTSPLDRKRERIAEIARRIAGLSEQRDGAMRRFDAAIAHHQEELAKLEQEIAGDERLQQPPPQPHHETPVEQKGPIEPAKAAESRPPKSRPAKPAGTKRKRKT